MKKRFCIVECSRTTNVPLNIYELSGIATLDSAYYVLAWHLAEKVNANHTVVFVLEIKEYPHWDEYEEANAAA